MASKGQKFNSYSPELKQTIINKYLNNQGTSRTLALEYNIPEKTINTWIYKHKHGKNISIDTRKTNAGRKKDENIDYKERYEILKKFQEFLEAHYEASNTKFTSKNFQIMPSVTITTDANLGQIFVNGEFTSNIQIPFEQGQSAIELSNLIAVSKQNSAFLYWLVTPSSGEPVQMPDNPLSMSIAENTTITAVFSNSLMDGVGVTAIGGGQVRMGGYIDDGEPNTTVVLNAIYYSGWSFDGWYTMENGVEKKLEDLSNSTAVTINVYDYEGKLIIARFVPNNTGNVNEDLSNS